MLIRNRTITALAFGLCFALLGGPDAAEAQDPAQQARSAVDSVSNRWSSAEDLEANFGLPLTDGSAMTSFDGAQSFSQPVSCLSSNAFLKLFFAPGPGGDIGTMVVQQDRDLDGAFDNSLAVPFPISGVCANGLISCAAGTWADCQPYLWTTSDDLALQLTPAALEETAACYCINDSCGQNLVVANESRIGSNLAAGMASALMARDARFSVASVGQAPFELTLSGQATSSCAGSPALTQTAYVSAPDALILDGSSAASADALFADLSTHPSVTGISQSTHECSIEKAARVISDITSVVEVSGPGEHTVEYVSATELVLTLGREGNNYLKESCSTGYIDNYTIRVNTPAALQSVVIEGGRVDDDLQLHRDGETLVFARRSNFTNYAGGRPGSCGGNANDSFSANQDITSIFLDGAEHEFRLRSLVSGKGERFLKIRFKIGCFGEVETSDFCTTFAADANCQLIDETVDGVAVFQNGAHTGLSPLPSSRTVSGGACSLTFHEPWWLRERRYQCTVAGGAASPPNLDRAAYIYSNSTAEIWADQYTDASGDLVTTSGSLDAPVFVDVGDCERTCKVRIEESDTQVATGGVISERKNSNIGTVYKFLPCSAGCPAGPGETVVQDCGCLDDFPEALTMMQAMRLAGQDAICTSGAPAPY